MNICKTYFFSNLDHPIPTNYDYEEFWSNITTWNYSAESTRINFLTRFLNGQHEKSTETSLFIICLTFVSKRFSNSSNWKATFSLILVANWNRHRTSMEASFWIFSPELSFFETAPSNLISGSSLKVISLNYYNFNIFILESIINHLLIQRHEDKACYICALISKTLIKVALKVLLNLLSFNLTMSQYRISSSLILSRLPIKMRFDLSQLKIQLLTLLYSLFALFNHQMATIWHPNYKNGSGYWNL